ncbi:hypothetical protein GQ54DRAFT_321867 [Martensiomyces pterosporus]|nr:hypothetical protein GQ54DRAFT_321867 [Martensiomyces pterosporus]
MKLNFTVAIAVFGTRAAAASASSPTLYIFGDSFSDIGTFKELTLGLLPSSPYWHGRFSSGPVWNEYLALLLNYSLYSMAVGGSKSANTGSSGILSINIPSTQNQINFFRLINPLYSQRASRNLDVAILEIGANDFLGNVSQISANTQTVDSFVNTLSNTVIGQLDQLRSIGFRNIVVTNLGAIHLTPTAKLQNIRGVANATVTRYNQVLASKANAWSQSANIGSFVIANLGGFVELTINSAAIVSALGLKDTTTSCVSGNTTNLAELQGKHCALLNFITSAKKDLMCSDPSTHYFFDSIHPAERIHRLYGYISKEVVSAIMQGHQYQMTEAKILALISQHNLGTPAPKPASV